MQLTICEETLMQNRQRKFAYYSYKVGSIDFTKFLNSKIYEYKLNHCYCSLNVINRGFFIAMQKEFDRQ